MKLSHYNNSLLRLALVVLLVFGVFGNMAVSYAIRRGNRRSPSTSTSTSVALPSPTFQDRFSNYADNQLMSDGTTFGPWIVIYTGYGSVEVESDGTNQWLHTSPRASTSAGETHAALVLGPSFTAPFSYDVTLRTVEQLRTGSSPNPWEVGWVVWNYTDDQHFYYVIVKPNGWELGKEDPAYPGAQRFLATGSLPTYPIGQPYTIHITQDAGNTIQVFVGGVLVTSFTDSERPYTSGQIGLYNEDAHVHFDDVVVQQ